MFYIWIDSMCRAKLPVQPSLTIAKAKNIPKSNYKASWQWLSWFKVHYGLQTMVLQREGAKVNKNDLELIALEELYKIIVQYDPENIYNMDEIGLFFRLLSKYLRQMTIHDIFN